MTKFIKQYPFVRIDLKEYGSDIIESLLLEGGIDLAGLTTYSKHEELQYILVEDEDLVLLTSKNSAIAKRISSGTPIDITEVHCTTVRHGRTTMIRPCTLTIKRIKFPFSRKGVR